MKKLLVLLFLLPLVYCGCNKSGGDCISSTGKIILQYRGNPAIDSINMADYVNLIITQDTINAITVEAGEHIIDGITTKVENGELIIRNVNSCNWTRDYGKPVNVHVRVKNLQLINYNSSGNITSTNEITTRKFRVNVNDGCGSINIKVNNEFSSFVEQMGTVDFVISGTVIFFDIFSQGYGPFHCDGVLSPYVYVTSRGSNDCYVKSVRELTVNILSIGNVYYTGNPETIRQNISGKGKLIPY